MEKWVMEERKGTKHKIGQKNGEACTPVANMTCWINRRNWQLWTGLLRGNRTPEPHAEQYASYLRRAFAIGVKGSVQSVSEIDPPIHDISCNLRQSPVLPRNAPNAVVGVPTVRADCDPQRFEGRWVVYQLWMTFRNRCNWTFAACLRTGELSFYCYFCTQSMPKTS